MAKLEFKYEEAMQEEGIELNDLPKSIRLKINAIKPNFARYEKNPSDAMREALVRQDVEIANEIYDWIEEQEKIEEEKRKEEEAKAEAEAKKKKEAEEAEAAKKKAAEEAAAAEEAKKKAAEEAAEAKKKAEEEEEEKRKAEEAAAAAKKKEEEEAAAAEEAKKKSEEEEENKKKEQKYKFGTLEMAQAIKEKIEAGGGNIPIDDLKAIIKKTPEYPHQEVYNIKLHKPYMKPYYVLV